MLLMNFRGEYVRSSWVVICPWKTFAHIQTRPSEWVPFCKLLATCLHASAVLWWSLLDWQFQTGTSFDYDVRLNINHFIYFTALTRTCFPANSGKRNQRWFEMQLRRVIYIWLTHGNGLSELINCRLRDIVCQDIAELENPHKERYSREAFENESCYCSSTPPGSDCEKLTGRSPLTLETFTILPLDSIKCGTASIVSWYMALLTSMTLICGWKLVEKRHSPHVCVHNSIKLSRRSAFNGALFKYPSIVNQHVKSPELGNRRINNLVHIVFIRQVT